MSSRRRIRFACIGVFVVVLSGLLAACGDGDKDNGDRMPIGSALDRRFLDEMVPHHRSAIEMAELARTRAEHPQIRTLAATIIATQGTEIAEIGRIKRGLPATAEDSTMGEAPIMHEMTSRELARLRSAKPFDQAFIELMVPHHQDAVRMSRAVIETGSDAKAEGLAERITFAQNSEIQRMRQWYRRWYGKPLPGASGEREVPRGHGAGHP